jgi:hypothetical protein
MIQKIEDAPKKSDTSSSESIQIEAEEFEAKLQEDNMYLLRHLRLKDFLVEVKDQNSNIRP